MILKTRLFGKIYKFNSVKEVLAKANEEKAGDKLACIAAESMEERAAAKVVLSEMTLSDLRNNPVIPYENDEITKIIQNSVDEEIYSNIKNTTVGEFRDYLLASDENNIKKIMDGLTSEMIAAVTKLMSNMDLVYVSNKLTNISKCNTIIGERGILASRLQANHPSDSIDGILASVKEGISYGIGDAAIGVNPVNDSIENISRILESLNEFTVKWKIPTQSCVLSHVITQMDALKKGVQMDLMFQGLTGTEASNDAVTINVKLMDEAYHMMDENKSSKGSNFMYFETRQGAELSLGCNNGADQLTLEARSYGFAKRYSPFLVNNVVGFIGPEYLYDGRQLIRAGIEGLFMGKLSGLTMGVDACYMNHMRVDQNDIENLALVLNSSNCSYFMGVPCSDDVMLMYESTSFHDIATMREISAKKPIKEFEKRMEQLGVMKEGRLTEKAGDPSIFK